VKKPGRDFREKVELWLAWRRVAKEVAEGTLGGDFDRSDRAELQSKVAEAEEAAREEVWASYRYVVIADSQEPDGLKTIDLGAGHSSGSETLCGRVITALKSQALLNESVGAGYIERNWPPALKDSGAWPLQSLRQSFLNGSLTRLLDPDTVLRDKIVEFVGKGEFGFASSQMADGSYAQVWFAEPLSPDDVAYEPGVFLLTRAKAQELKTGPEKPPLEPPTLATPPEPAREPELRSGPSAVQQTQPKTIRLRGSVPPETWNRLGTTILPKLRSGSNLAIDVDFSVTLDATVARGLVSELQEILYDLGLADKMQFEEIGPATESS
jgi:hypothetical protein